jgi:hypothetical protein
LLEAGQAVLIEADAQSDNRGGESSDQLRFIARSIEPLASAAERASQGVRIRLYEPTVVPAIQKFLKALPAGRGKVMFQVELDDGEEAEVELKGAWLLNESAKAGLRQLGDGLEVAEY